MDTSKSRLTNGAAAAAVLAVGLGCVALGVLTTLKASSDTIKRLLAFYTPTGPLSGQTAIAVAVWLISWLLLHKRWENKEVKFKKIFIIALALIILGLVGCFPPLFEAFFEAYE